MSKPPKTYDEFYAELQRQADKDREASAKKATVNVDSEEYGFGQFCIWILFALLGVLATAYVLGMI